MWMCKLGVITPINTSSTGLYRWHNCLTVVSVVRAWNITMTLITGQLARETAVQGRGSRNNRVPRHLGHSGDGMGGIHPGQHCVGGGIWRGKNYILKFGRFWQIGICIVDSDNFTLTLPRFWNHTPNCQCSTTPHKAVCTPRNLHCWPDWSFTCCKII